MVIYSDIQCFLDCDLCCTWTLLYSSCAFSHAAHSDLHFAADWPYAASYILLLLIMPWTLPRPLVFDVTQQTLLYGSHPMMMDEERDKQIESWGEKSSFLHSNRTWNILVRVQNKKEKNTNTQTHRAREREEGRVSRCSACNPARCSVSCGLGVEPVPYVLHDACAPCGANRPKKRKTTIRHECVCPNKRLKGPVVFAGRWRVCVHVGGIVPLLSLFSDLTLCLKSTDGP